jgi:uncharacterized RDD family membrane protein YckC
MPASVEITTTQNVTIEYDLAQLRERAGAYMLDVLLVSICYTVLMVMLFSLFGSNNTDSHWWVFVYVGYFIALFFYFILMEIMSSGQTVGKKALGLKVVRLDGKEPKWSDVVLRSVLQVVDIIFSGGIIGILLIKTTPRNQRLGDLAANTVVIKIQSTLGRFTLRDILNIASLDNYQPVYPQVRSLTEKDMIFIKNALVRYQKYPNPAHADVVGRLTERLMHVLEIHKPPMNQVEFLRTLLRDYIVLTR